MGRAVVGTGEGAGVGTGEGAGVGAGDGDAVGVGVVGFGVGELEGAEVGLWINNVDHCLRDVTVQMSEQDSLRA